jgi:hypothetical protein
VFDGKCVRVDGLDYWVYAVLDVDGSRVLSMRIYSSKYSYHQQFIDV